MNKKFFWFILAITLFIIPSVNAQTKFFKINFLYDQGDFSLLSAEIELTEEVRNSFGGYVANIISFDDHILEVSFFGVPSKLVFEKTNQKGEVIAAEILYLNQTNFTLYLPYYENAREIRIYDPNMTLLLTIPVSQFSKNLCGDGTCQFYEDMKSCPADCVAVKEEVKIEEKPLTEKIASYVEENKTMFVVSAVLFVILIIFIILISRKKPEKS